MNYDNKEINSPFRYAGGKYYARKLILPRIPSHEQYIEPFAGGASIFFAKNKSPYNWLNDIDEDVANCLICIRDTPEELIQFLDGLPATKELHTYYKNEFRPANPIEKAGRWYYLNRTSYSGIMNPQNCYWGYGPKYSMRPENWPRNIRRTSQKLQGVKITALDYKEVIEDSPDGSFLFVDPPYYNADQDKFYSHHFTKEDHSDLVGLLRSHAHRLHFLITYDNTPDIWAMYDWCQIVEEEWNYTINRTDDQTGRTNAKGRRYKGKEVLIMNYDSLALCSSESVS